MSGPSCMIILFITTAIVPLLCTCTMWDGSFLEADLTFVFTRDGNKLMDVDSDFPYFDIVRNNNSYTPVKHFVLNQSIFLTKRKIWKYLRVHGYRSTEKSSRAKAIFINLLASTTWVNKCQNLLSNADVSFQQEILFLSMSIAPQICVAYSGTLDF